MILNDNEKAELITALKRQYNENKEYIANGNFPLWVQDEKQREEFISCNEKLKKQIDTLESEEICEITFNKNFLKGDNTWWAIIALCVLFGLGGFNGGCTPEDNPYLN